MAGSEAIVSKGRFAELCNVSPGRVTQWISEGKINGDALVGEGRGAKIVVAIAQRQIRARTDSGQAFGNGLGTKLNQAAAARPNEPGPEPTDDAGEPLVGDAIDQQIKRERLDALQRANRRGAEEEAAALGRYTETTAVRRQLTMVASQTMRFFEGALPEIATELAAALKVDERDVLQRLNESFRKVRDQASKASTIAAEALPEHVEETQAP